MSRNRSAHGGDHCLRERSLFVWFFKSIQRKVNIYFFIANLSYRRYDEGKTPMSSS
jgi:hypothetical protein